jgi:hypothetical protein
MSKYGFSTDPVAITSSVVPNPGISKTERVIATVSASKVAMLSSVVFVTWPAHVALISVAGPIGISIAVGAATWLMIRRQKTTEMAIDEFAELGVAPEVIGSVIVESRTKAWTILGYNSQFALVQENVDAIGQEVVDIIDGFKDDTSDIHRCRHVVARCLDQAIKILQNLEVFEKRIESTDSIRQEDYQSTLDLSVDGLSQIKDALIEQHRRNLDNNQNELEIDLKIADQLFS